VASSSELSLHRPSSAKDRVSEASAASRNLPLKTDHRENVCVKLPEIVTIGLNILLEPGHPLQENLCQSPLFEGPHDALDGR
jgi:hypothetical protein